MGAVTLDTSVVIGFLRREDAHHAAAHAGLAAARMRGDEFVLPASVLSEAMVGGYRNGTARDLHGTILALFGPVRTVDENVAMTAARIRASHTSLRLPDALVVATGIVDDATVLTCDRRMASVDARVQVLGP